MAPWAAFFLLWFFRAVRRHYWIPLVATSCSCDGSLFCVFAIGAEMLASARDDSAVARSGQTLSYPLGRSAKTPLTALLAATILFFVKSWRDPMPTAGSKPAVID
jgi:hypothetical protein